MTHRDHKEPNDLSHKLRDEGTGSLGAGSWPGGEKTRPKTPAAAPPPGDGRAHSVPPGKTAPCRLGDRILTGLAILALGMLIVGALGAYLSPDSRPVAAGTRGGDATASRLDELERRMADLSDRHGQRLHSLEMRAAQGTDPFEARLKNVESRLTTPGDGDAARLEALEKRLGQFDAPTYEARLQAIENRLAQAYAPDEAGLRDMENRLGQTYTAYDARLRELEGRLMQLQIPYEQRLQELERRLIYASARLDYLSAQMDSVTNNNSAIIEANASLHADPPAAVPVAAFASAPVEPRDPPPLQPGMQEAKAATTAPPEMPADADGSRTFAPVAETPPDGALSPAAPTEVAGEMPSAGKPTAAPGEVPAEAVSDPAPEAVSPPAAAAPAQDKPVETVPDIHQDGARSQAGTGEWVINLASYASEAIAARKLADFKKQGVSAEQVAATVNGKTLYRVRLAGFDTRKAALAQAQAVGQKLGLKETWVTKR